MSYRFSLLLLLAAAPSWAATFNVTNNADAGAGSLRQAVTDANTAGGANTISWTTGGTTALLTDLPALNDLTTLDVSAAPAAVTVSGVMSVPMIGATTFNNGNA